MLNWAINFRTCLSEITEYPRWARSAAGPGAGTCNCRQRQLGQMVNSSCRRRWNLERCRRPGHGRHRKPGHFGNRICSCSAEIQAQGSCALRRCSLGGSTAARWVGSNASPYHPAVAGCGQCGQGRHGQNIHRFPSTRRCPSPVGRSPNANQDSEPFGELSTGRHCPQPRAGARRAISGRRRNVAGSLRRVATTRYQVILAT